MGGRVVTPPFLTSTVVSFILRPLYPLSPPAGKYDLASVACPGGLGEKEKFFPPQQLKHDYSSVHRLA